MSRQSIVSFFFSLLYTLLVVSKSSGCSWCPAHIPVAFVISGTLAWLPAASNRGLSVASQPTCALRAALKRYCWEMDQYCSSLAPRVGKQTRTRCCSQMPPSRTEPSCLQGCPLWAAFPSLLTFSVPSKSLLGVPSQRNHEHCYKLTALLQCSQSFAHLGVRVLLHPSKQILGWSLEMG